MSITTSSRGRGTYSCPCGGGRTINELKKEIDGLRAENSELKFHLYLHLPHIVLRPGQTPLPSAFPTPGTKDATTSTPTDPRVERLQSQVTSAEKLVEELQWLNVHQDQRLFLQEMKVQELQKELHHQKEVGMGVEIFQLQIPSLHQHPRVTTPPTTTPTATPTETRKRSSSSDSRLTTSGTRRPPSLQSLSLSLLPHDYKESVSTLPPIKAQDLLKVKFTSLHKPPRFHHHNHTHHIPSATTPLHPHQPLKSLLHQK